MTTSIIISMYNKKGKTLEVIDKLLMHSILNNASSSKELVLMDDASPLKDETQRLIEEYTPLLKSSFGNFVFSRNDFNLGFGASYNRGVSLSSGDSLLIANDDIYLPLGSIDALVNTLSENPRFGMVGPITNESQSWSYQYCKQAPKISSYSNEELANLEHFADYVRGLMKGERIKTDVITGFCFAIKADLMRSMRGFDNVFKYGFFEDTDLSRRVGENHDVIINPEIFVSHGSVDGSSGSVKQHPLKAISYLFKNGYEYGKKYGHLHTLKYSLKGMNRAFTGNDTVSDLFEQKLA